MSFTKRNKKSEKSAISKKTQEKLLESDPELKTIAEKWSWPVEHVINYLKWRAGKEDDFQIFLAKRKGDIWRKIAHRIWPHLNLEAAISRTVRAYKRAQKYLNRSKEPQNHLKGKTDQEKFEEHYRNWRRSHSSRRRKSPGRNGGLVDC